MAKYLQGVKKKGSNVSVPADDMDDLPLPMPDRDVSSPDERKIMGDKAKWEWETRGQALTKAERRGARFSPLPTRAGERISYDKSEMDRFGQGPPKRRK
jgi:hypothetical protein